MNSWRSAKPSSIRLWCTHQSRAEWWRAWCARWRNPLAIWWRGPEIDSAETRWQLEVIDEVRRPVGSHRIGMYFVQSWLMADSFSVRATSEGPREMDVFAVWGSGKSTALEANKWKSNVSVIMALHVEYMVFVGYGKTFEYTVRFPWFKPCFYLKRDMNAGNSTVESKV